MLEDLQKFHNESKQKKWLVMVAGFIFFGVVAYVGTSFGYKLTISGYDRAMLSELLAEKFTRFKISDTPSAVEMMIVSYAYDENEPRLYSKYFAAKNKYVYDIQVNHAIEGASSILMYFDPFSLQLGVNNEEVLVDGAIIAENPSLYSTFMAKELG